MMRRSIAVAATVALAAASATASPAAGGPATPVAPADAAAASSNTVGGGPARELGLHERHAASGGAVNDGKTTAAAGGGDKADRLREATRSLLRKKIEAEMEEKRREREEEEERRGPQNGTQQQHGPPTPEELEARRLAKKARTAERRRRAAEKIARMKPDDATKLERVNTEELRRIASRARADDPDGTKPQNQWLRSLGWFDGGGGGGSGVPGDYSPYDDGYADPGYQWDMWAQAYRMLGGFIDCDWQQGEEDDRRKLRDQNDRDLSGSGMEGTENGCGRWMMWAAYVNPNYQGGGYEEYFGSNEDGGGGDSSLDCHSPNTEWQLMGVYREEFYQYLEQISKHLWAVDDYEYAIALGGLAYMTDADCFEVNGYYAGILPGEGGTFTMSIFTDDACLYPDDSTNLDAVGYYPGMNNDNGRRVKEDECRRRLEDGGNSQLDCDSYALAQEYTLTEMNSVYDTYRYCTLCIDYPTYQDGYLIGDYGTDEDDLINQCWKFHSHDSFPCNGDCIALGSMQGSILQVQVGKTLFGTEWEGTSQVVNSEGQVVKSNSGASRLDRIKANLFLTFAGILFVATFLAFAVARGSGRERRSRSSKSRSLLTAEEKRRARSSSRRGHSSRSKSGQRRSKSRGEGRSSSRGAHEKRSSSRKSRSGGEGGSSPRKSSSKSKSKSSRSRRHLDDF